MQWIRVLLLVLALSPGSAAGESLNIDFGHIAGPSPLGAGFGAASGQTGEWNTITAIGSTFNLAALNGLPTDVSLTLGPGVVNPNGSSALLTGDLKLLMGDFFFEDSNSDFWNVTLSGIDPGVYDVYAYAPANLSASQGTGTFTINGVAMSGIPGSGIQNFIQGVNFEVLSGLSVTDGTISFDSTESGTRFLGLSAIQLVQVPEPTTGLLLAAGLAALGSRRRFRR